MRQWMDKQEAWSSDKKTKPSYRGLILSLSQVNHFCPTEEKRLWTTTIRVVTQTHLSRIAQKSLSVLCRVSIQSRTRKINKDFKYLIVKTLGLHQRAKSIIFVILYCSFQRKL